MIMTNLYGTIVSNLACGLIGGPGLLSGSNMGPKVSFNGDNGLTVFFSSKFSIRFSSFQFQVCCF